MDLWNSVLGLFSDTQFYLRVAGGLVAWYLAAIFFAHLLFGRGNMEATDAAVNGALVSMVTMTIAAALLGYFAWGSVALAATWGVMMLFLPLCLTFGLQRLGKR